jgi:hypothetical protein
MLGDIDGISSSESTVWVSYAHTMMIVCLCMCACIWCSLIRFLTSHTISCQIAYTKMPL